MLWHQVEVVQYGQPLALAFAYKDIPVVQIEVVQTGPLGPRDDQLTGIQHAAGQPVLAKAQFDQGNSIDELLQEREAAAAVQANDADGPGDEGPQSLEIPYRTVPAQFEFRNVDTVSFPVFFDEFRPVYLGGDGFTAVHSAVNHRTTAFPDAWPGDEVGRKVRFSQRACSWRCSRGR